MAAMNFASTACSAGNRGQLVDAVSKWLCRYTDLHSAIAAAAGRVWLSTPTVPNAELIVAATARTLKT
ncbi:hypothetical protein CEK26_009485 [Fusarium fujikuroi]|nr:hypothetical protein CEK27_009507 [Fusarium fujikuroi]QGI82785.1 hypothetical protein CEK25_009514 [Fusarium fujikuroi]QGI96416.1 hypothetical protein CEK26_009485 [Fusarium fujikuroi]